MPNFLRPFNTRGEKQINSLIWHSNFGICRMSNGWNCPYCGKSLDKPRTAWSVRHRNPTKYTVMGHFLCDNCGRTFRMAIGTRISSRLPRPRALIFEGISTHETGETNIIKTEIPGLFSEIEIDKLSNEFIGEYFSWNLPKALNNEFRLRRRDFSDYWERACALPDTFGLPSSAEAGVESERRYRQIRSLWKKFRRIFQIKVIESLRKTGYINLVDIHCPKRKGCVGTYHEESSLHEEQSCRLRVFGFGGGKGIEAKIGVGKSIQARDGNCYSLVVPAKLTIEKCDLFKWGIRRHRFYRVSVTDIGNNFRKCVIPPSLDNCQIPISDIRAREAEWTVECWDSSESSEDEVDEYACYLERGTRSSFSTMVSLPWTRSEIGISTEVNLIKKIRYAYQLKGGCKYYAYRPQDHLGYYWTVDHIQR